MSQGGGGRVQPSAGTSGNIASLSPMRLHHSRGYLVAYREWMDELARHLADDRVVAVDVREVAGGEPRRPPAASRPQIGEVPALLQSMASRSCRVIVPRTRSRRRQTGRPAPAGRANPAASA